MPRVQLHVWCPDLAGHWKEEKRITVSARNLLGNGEIVIALDKDLHIVDACSLNSPRDHILSYRLEELISLGWRELIHEEDLDQFVELLSQLPRVPGTRVRGSVRLSMGQLAAARYTIEMGMLDYSSLDCQSMRFCELPASALYEDRYLLVVWMEIDKASQSPTRSVELEPGVFLHQRVAQDRDFTLSLLEKMGCHVLAITGSYRIQYVNSNTRSLVGDVLGRKCYQCIGLDAPCVECRVKALFDHEEDSISYETSVCFHRFHVVASLLAYPCGTPVVLLAMTDLTGERPLGGQAAQDGVGWN